MTAADSIERADAFFGSNNNILFYCWLIINKPHPPFRGHLTRSRGCPLNRGSTVTRSKPLKKSSNPYLSLGAFGITFAGYFFLII